METIMETIIVAGISKNKGSQFSLKKEQSLYYNDRLMTYNNLLKSFKINSMVKFDDYNTPYLSGIYLYNYLTKRGVSCGLINFIDLELDDFERMLMDNPKSVVLSTTFLVNIVAVKRVSEIIRMRAPDIKIILGGPLVYNSYLIYKLRNSDYHTEPCTRDFFFLNKEPSTYEDIDLFIVEEQGEHTLLNVINALKHNKNYDEIPNLAYYRNDRLLFTNRKPEQNDFKEDLISWQDVPDNALYPIFPIRGSRGCPYKCKYCNFSTGRRFQFKDVEIIISEIKALANTGKVNMIRFTDDNLFLDRKHLELFCRKLMQTETRIKWTSFIRASSITEDNIELLKDTGCVLAQIGMESGDPGILKEMNKKSSPADYLRAIELLNGIGISTQLYFIIGFPGETRQSIENTIEMINKFYYKGPAINEYMVFPFIFAPLSPIYHPNEAKQYGINGYMDKWSHRTMNSDEAWMLAHDFIENVERIYPHYGIEEFLLVEIPVLKEISQLRHQIKRAEKNSGGIIVDERNWKSLRKLITLHAQKHLGH